MSARVSCSSNWVTSLLHVSLFMFLLNTFCHILLYLHFLNGHTDDYFLSRLPVVEKRLAQAGVRLAATLNRIFTSTAINVTKSNVLNGDHRTSYNTEIM